MISSKITADRVSGSIETRMQVCVFNDNSVENQNSARI